MRRFYTSSPEERQKLVIDRHYASEETLNNIKEGLSIETADQMVENTFGIYGLPYSLAFNFLINGKDYQVPMVTEEPSVVAAASGAAKTIKAAGGFTVDIPSRELIGQVALMDIEQVELAKSQINREKGRILQLANEAYPSIVQRGGGARDLSTRYIPADESKGTQEFLVVYLKVDTQEAMGANMMNTMLEAISNDLEDLSGGTALMSILSNYADASLVTASCRIPFDQLNYKKIEGDKLAKKIEAASQLAQVDHYRATTHNKGIMNGVDAVVLATGNDWRAIEAGAHAYANQDGAYRGLSQWWIEEECLLGELTLPMPIGTVGGSISIHPYAQASFDILNIDGGQAGAARELAGIITSVGLAQNFAAIRALVSEGIQKGHMTLQAKSLALSVGAKQEEVSLLARQLKQAKTMNQETAKHLLEQIRQGKQS